MTSLAQESLAQLYVCPTCNHDSRNTRNLRFHLQRHHGCLNRTGLTLEGYLQKIKNKKWRLTNKKQYKESRRKEVLIIKYINNSISIQSKSQKVRLILIC